MSSQLEDFTKALQEITECKGAFNRDPFTHARNCVSGMQAVAVHVLRKHGITPRREDDPDNGEPIPLRQDEI